MLERINRSLPKANFKTSKLVFLSLNFKADKHKNYCNTITNLFDNNFHLEDS